MPHEELGPILEALHKSLTNNVPLDDEDVSRLRAIVDEVQAVIRPKVNSVEQMDSNVDTGLKGRLDEFIAEFEQQHPQLTNSLAVIAERLSDMGI